MTYPPQYPPQQGYPPAQPGYPPQQGYPPAQPGYQQPYAPAGYPPQPGYPPQQGYGQPQPPRQAGPRGTLEEFFDQPSASGKSLSGFFKQPGQSVTGRVARPITDADIQAQTDINSGQVRQFRDGRPMFVMVVPLIIPTGPEFPDGRAAWYVRGQARDELARAMAEAGCPPELKNVPEAGADITITFLSERPIPGRNNQKVYQITYRRPDGAAQQQPPAAAQANGYAQQPDGGAPAQQLPGQPYQQPPQPPPYQQPVPAPPVQPAYAQPAYAQPAYPPGMDPQAPQPPAYQQPPQQDYGQQVQAINTQYPQPPQQDYGQQVQAINTQYPQPAYQQPAQAGQPVQPGYQQQALQQAPQGVQPPAPPMAPPPGMSPERAQLLATIVGQASPPGAPPQQ